jgi:hypothetical protein
LEAFLMSNMNKVDVGSSDAPAWVERLCTAVRHLREPGATIAKVFSNADPDLSDRVRFCRLVGARLHREPELINAWESLSADNRSTPCPYFRGNEVGDYDGGYQDVVRYDERADACADFLFRRSTSVLAKR